GYRSASSGIPWLRAASWSSSRLIPVASVGAATSMAEAYARGAERASSVHEVGIVRHRGVGEARGEGRIHPPTTVASGVEVGDALDPRPDLDLRPRRLDPARLPA